MTNDWKRHLNSLVFSGISEEHSALKTYPKMQLFNFFIIIMLVTYFTLKKLGMSID